MAIGITLIADGNDVWGRTRIQQFLAALDTSYPTGGYPITPAQLALRTILGIIVRAVNTGFVTNSATFAGLIPVWNTTTGKLQLIVASTGAELANASNVSATVLTLEAAGPG